MALILIDTNSYLRFYDSNIRDFKQLLPPIKELKDSIFITKQIVDEVNRNKLGCICRLLGNYRKHLNISKDMIPVHFDTDDNNAASDWNKRKEKLIEANEKLISELCDYTKNISSLVEKSEDRVSIILQDVFSNASQPNEDEINNAKKRKELGNPPGKKEDPIGDELIWEQLLSKYKKNNREEIWIVSSDSDFMIDINGELKLNPFLYSELKEIADNNKPVLRLFKTLSDAIKTYQVKINRNITIPDSDTMDKIEKEEQRVIEAKALSTSFRDTMVLSDSISFTHYRICKLCGTMFVVQEDEIVCPNCPSP